MNLRNSKFSSFQKGTKRHKVTAMSVTWAHFCRSTDHLGSHVNNKFTILSLLGYKNWYYTKKSKFKNKLFARNLMTRIFKNWWSKSRCTDKKNVLDIP